MKIVIIGNGISGVTAARTIRKLSDHPITIISSESDHFFSRTALMYIYMGHMTLAHTKPYEDKFWDQNNIDLLNKHVNNIDFDQKTLYLADNTTMAYDKLIIATGSKPNKFGWPGQDLEGVSGLYSLQDLQYIESLSPSIQKAVIVGGGLIGIELAEMFHSRGIEVTFLVREGSYWNAILPPEESAMVNKIIESHHIDLRLNTELKEILPDKNGRASAVLTSTGEKIDCQFVGITAGVHPNIEFLKNTALEIQKGILVNDYLETNQKDVYAIGDCAQVRQPTAQRRPIEAVWYVGRMMGEVVGYNVVGQAKKHRPQHWFNSAKFFNVEYQVYGHVAGKIPDTQSTFYWTPPNQDISFRVVFDKASKHLIGFKVMGLRLRHEVCEKWILNSTNINDVMENLGLAMFDPEFYKKHEVDIINAYNQKFGKNIPVRQRKRDLNLVQKFLQNAIR